MIGFFSVVSRQNDASINYRKYIVQGIDVSKCIIIKDIMQSTRTKYHVDIPKVRRYHNRLDELR
jgi:hypothetical protein